MTRGKDIKSTDLTKMRVYKGIEKKSRAIKNQIKIRLTSKTKASPAC